MSGLKNAGLTIIAGLAFIIGSPGRISAQEKQTQSVQQTWFGYFNQTRFSNKLGLWVDAHLRTKEDFITDFSQAVGRIGLTYYLSDDVKLTAGYAYVNHFPSDNHKNISQPEHSSLAAVAMAYPLSRITFDAMVSARRKMAKKNIK